MYTYIHTYIRTYICLFLNIYLQNLVWNFVYRYIRSTNTHVCEMHNMYNGHNKFKMHNMYIQNVLYVQDVYVNEIHACVTFVFVSLCVCVRPSACARVGVCVCVCFFFLCVCVCLYSCFRCCQGPGIIAKAAAAGFRGRCWSRTSNNRMGPKNEGSKQVMKTCDSPKRTC